MLIKKLLKLIITVAFRLKQIKRLEFIPQLRFQKGNAATESDFTTREIQPVQGKVYPAFPFPNALALIKRVSSGGDNEKRTPNCTACSMVGPLAPVSWQCMTDRPWNGTADAFQWLCQSRPPQLITVWLCVDVSWNDVSWKKSYIRSVLDLNLVFILEPAGIIRWYNGPSQIYLYRHRSRSFLKNIIQKMMLGANL